MKIYFEGVYTVVEKMTEKQKNFVKQTLAETTNLLKDVVKDIEESIPLSRGHYAKYMSVISSASKNQPHAGMLIALALVKAGANFQGVSDAVKLLYQYDLSRIASRLEVEV